jgi:hypothetical protein
MRPSSNAGSGNQKEKVEEVTSWFPDVTGILCFLRSGILYSFNRSRFLFNDLFLLLKTQLLPLSSEQM